MKDIFVSVIISTYNNPKWLSKVLWGYSIQSYKKMELIIADDGSKDETLNLINAFKKHYPYRIIHLWHEDLGYRRQTILNKAIVEANGDYIIMTDGDCIPKYNFVETHASLAEKGKFLSAGYCKLSLKLSEVIEKKDILSQDCFDSTWLRKRDKIGFSNYLKLGQSIKTGVFLDKITTTNTSFSNCNSSGWKIDFIRINGYDERMLYGGADRDIGERLNNSGILGVQIRHRAIVVHLEHSRGYKNKDSIIQNLKIRDFNRKNKIIETPYGIETFSHMDKKMD